MRVFTLFYERESVYYCFLILIYMYKLSKERIRIARNIKLIRELRNFNQRYVANEMGIGRSTLSTWENGLVELKIETLELLAIVYGLSNYRDIIDFDPELLFNKKKK